MCLAPIVCNQLLKGLQVTTELFFCGKRMGRVAKQLVNHQDEKNIQSHVFSLAKCYFPPKDTVSGPYFGLLLENLECCSRESFFEVHNHKSGTSQAPRFCCGSGNLTTLEPEVLHRYDASQNDHKSKGFIPKTDYLNISHTCNVATLHHVVCHTKF